MGTELATAYVTILPSTKGLGTSLIDQLKPETDAAGKAAGESISKGMSSTLKVGAAITAFGAGLTLALNGAAEAAVGYGSEVVNIQRLTGLAAKESSDWAAIMGRYGVEAKQVALVIRTLSVAIEGHSEALNENGIKTQDASGKNRDSLEVFADLAEWYSKCEDKVLANTVAAGALGRSYSSLLPLLAGGRKGIEDLTAAAAKNGLELTQTQINAVKAYGKAVKDNEDATKGLTLQVGLLVLPLKTQMTQALGGVLEKLNELDPALKQAAVGFGVVAAGTADVVGPMLTTVALLPDMVKGLNLIKTTGAGIIAQAGGMAGLAITAAGMISYATGIGILAVAYAKLAPEAQTYAQLVKSGDMDPPSGWEQFAAPISTAAYWIEVWTGGAEKAAGATDSLTRSLEGLMVAEDSVAGRTRSATESQQANRLAIADLNDAVKRQSEVYADSTSSADNKARADIAVAQAQQRVKDTGVNAAKATEDLKRAQAGAAAQQGPFAASLAASSAATANLASKAKMAADQYGRLFSSWAKAPKAPSTVMTGQPKGGHALGTITSGPEYALIGEGGYPETVASWDPRYRARTVDLLNTTIAGLDLTVQGGGSSAPSVVQHITIVKPELGFSDGVRAMREVEMGLVFA